MDEEQGSLKLLLVVQFTQRFRGGIISPILALFIRGQGLAVSELGLIGTAGMLGWFIFEPLAGVVADRVRKKYLVIFAILASSLIYLVYPLARDFWHFSLLAFAMSSVMSAYAVSVRALTAELLPSSERGKTYGRFVSVISIGGIIGPFLGGYLSEVFDHAVPFYISASVGIIGLSALIIMRYDDRKSREKPLVEDTPRKNRLWTKPFIIILITRMLFIFNLVFRQHILPVYLNENPRFKASETQIGLYIGIMQLTSAFSQAFVGDLIDRTGSRRIIASSLFLSGFSYMGLLYISGSLPLFFLGALQGAFFSAADMSMMIHLMDIMPKDRTGIVMGIYSESENVGGMMAAPSLGMIYDAVGPAFSVISVSTILIFNACLPIVLMREERREKKLRH